MKSFPQVEHEIYKCSFSIVHSLISVINAISGQLVETQVNYIPKEPQRNFKHVVIAYANGEMLYCTSTSTRNEDILPWQLLWSTKGIRSL